MELDGLAVVALVAFCSLVIGINLRELYGRATPIQDKIDILASCWADIDGKEKGYEKSREKDGGIRDTRGLPYKGFFNYQRNANETVKRLRAAGWDIIPMV